MQGDGGRPQGLHETGFVRLTQVLEVIPIGKSCWWQGVKSGRYPKPVKLSKRCTAWRVEDIQVLIKQLSGQTQKAETNLNPCEKSGV